MSPVKIPLSKFQQENAAPKGKKAKISDQPSQQIADHLSAIFGETDPATEALANAAADDHAQALEAAGLNAESYGSDDETGGYINAAGASEMRDAMIAPTTPDLTYVNDDQTQAPPDDPRIDPTFEQPTTPAPKKGKVKAVKVKETPATEPTPPAPEPPPAPKGKGKTKGKDQPKEQPIDTSGKTSIVRDISPVVGNVALAVANNRNFAITALGMKVEGEPTFEQWADYGNAMGVMRNGLEWSDYDWAKWGEDHYGESYAQWMDATGLKAQTLYNRMNALKRYTVAQRVYGVSISAHVEAAALDPMIRDMVLKEMQSGKLQSIGDLRKRINEIKRGVDEASGNDGKDKDKGNDNDDGGTDEDSEVDTRKWTEQGTFLFTHAGDGIFEPVLDDAGDLPEALRALLKGKKLKGVVRLTIAVAS